MAFPTSPSSGDQYVFRGVQYTWNGNAWTYQAEGIPGKSPTVTKVYSGPFSEDPEVLLAQTYRGQGDGGYEFTGGFADRLSGVTGNLIADNVQYTNAQAAGRIWRRFGFDPARQVANDVAYWSDPNPAFDQSKGLFGGVNMPDGCTDLFDFADTSAGAAVTTGDLQYTAADGSYDFRQCRVGDLAKVRFSFMVTPQQANTTVEVGLIWNTRDKDDVITATVPLTTQPIFFGTGSVGNAYLNRVEISAYFANDEDVNTRALPAIRADNEVLIKPLSTLCTIVR